MSKKDLSVCAVIKKYSVFAKDGNKYIGLRIANRKAEQITGIEVAVKQYDRRNKPLGVKVIYNERVADGHWEFLWLPKTPLDSRCERCEAEITAVIYGEYRYTLVNNRVELSYVDRLSERIVRKYYTDKFDCENRRLQTHGSAKGVRAVLLCALIAVLAGVIAFGQYKIYRASLNQRDTVTSQNEQISESDGVK